MPATFTETLPATKSSSRTAITWTPDPSRPGCGRLVIHAARCSCAYRVSPVPTGWEGKGFTLTKDSPGSDAESDTYHVFCHRHRQDNLCGCRGFERWGHCKHVAACLALIENGWDELSPVNPDQDVACTECPF